ncbi:hypothetical protein TNCV_2516521 [Trichonephila clavipes]|nr:hypothetical protein TNCV_2516521 [Trichonephila clavipes]
MKFHLTPKAIELQQFTEQLPHRSFVQLSSPLPEEANFPKKRKRPKDFKCITFSMADWKSGAALLCHGLNATLVTNAIIAWPGITCGFKGCHSGRREVLQIGEEDAAFF